MRVLLAAFVCGLLLGFLWNAPGQDLSSTPNLPITNLVQIVELLNSNESLRRDVHLEATVCAASDPEMGVVILQDETDTELFEFSGGAPELSPGDKVVIDQNNCLLRRREMGVQISASPVVDNNGIHAMNISGGGIRLTKGRHPLVLEWFNRVHPPGLEVQWQVPGSQLKNIPDANLTYSVMEKSSARQTFHSGLRAECYEGDWERVPNFDLLRPVKTVIATNFYIKVRTREELAGVRFSGFLEAPVDGVYNFTTRSADGSLLFIGDPTVSISRIENGFPPSPALVTIDEPLIKFAKQQWVTLVGRVGSINPVGRGLEMELYSERNSLQVRIADDRGLNLSNLLNSQIQVTGVGRSLFNLKGNTMLGQIFVACSDDVKVVHPSMPDENASAVLAKAKQVQTLALNVASQHVPVRLRGVVTSKGVPTTFGFRCRMIRAGYLWIFIMPQTVCQCAVISMKLSVIPARGILLRLLSPTS